MLFGAFVRFYSFVCLYSFVCFYFFVSFLFDLFSPGVHEPLPHPIQAEAQLVGNLEQKIQFLEKSGKRPFVQSDSDADSHLL